MTDKVIYDDDGTRAELDTDLDVIVLTSQPFWKKENTLLLTVKEIDAIHAAIHADDEPEPVEADCCGNCFFGRQSSHPDYVSCCFSAPQMICGSGTGWQEWDWAAVKPEKWCGEHRPKE